MPDRREFLTGGVASGALLSLPAPASALAASPSSALLLEFRRLAARVVVIEAIDPLEPFYAIEDAGVQFDFKTLEPFLNAATERHRVAIAAYMPELSSISCQIWATPAADWAEIVARAELAKFWNRGEGYEDHHGYDDSFANMRLIDAVLAVAAADPPGQSRMPIPPFDPPPALLEWREFDAQKARLFAIRDQTTEEHFKDIELQCRLETAVLKETATCWGDIVVRAELMSWRRRGHLAGCCWLRLDDDDGRHCNHRSFAELLTAILRLGNCPPLADVDDICWRREARAYRAKSRLRHAAVKALRKTWRARFDRASAA
jgi:hypothetical protein